MVADAIIYHPTVAHYLRFVATTGGLNLGLSCWLCLSCRPNANILSFAVGRDKLLRTLQYFSRFYAWYLFRTNNPARLVAPYEAIKKQFGLTRKALRLGKNVEHFKAAAVAADSKNMDPVLKYCAVGRQLGYAMYLSLDAVTYVSAYLQCICGGAGVKQELMTVDSLTLLVSGLWQARRDCSRRLTGRGLLG